MVLILALNISAYQDLEISSFTLPERSRLEVNVEGGTVVITTDGTAVGSFDLNDPNADYFLSLIMTFIKAYALANSGSSLPRCVLNIDQTGGDIISVKLSYHE